MDRNKMKIVCKRNVNINKNCISYYYKNERREWVRVSNLSELSRKEYTFTSIQEKASDVLHIINETYNPGNRGVDIFFEGSDDDFAILCNILKNNYSDDNITCQQKNTKIAVMGKIGSGKSTLIEEMGHLLNAHFTINQGMNFVLYADKIQNTEWYELNGIDLGKENMGQAQIVLDELINNGLTSLVYCFGTSKTEELEEEILLNIRENHPEVKILVALTSCINDDAPFFAEKLSKSINQAKVIPVLAKELRSREGVIPQFGLDQIAKYIFEGK